MPRPVCGSISIGASNRSPIIIPFSSRGIPAGYVQFRHARPIPYAVRRHGVVEFGGSSTYLSASDGRHHHAANETESPRYRAIAGRESRNTKRQLEAYSRTGPPRLGVRWRAPTKSENDVDGGVIVEGVNSGSAAAECGLQRGDRIVRIAGHVVNKAEEFPGMVATARNPVDIRVVRNGAETPVRVDGVAFAANRFDWGFRGMKTTPNPERSF